MSVDFASEHSLCTDHCNAVNSNTGVTSATYNVCAGYLTIWYYSHNNFDTKESISRLSQLFYENQLAKEKQCFHGSFLSIHCQIGNQPTINKTSYVSSIIWSKFENIWNNYLIFRNFLKKLIVESDSRKGKANPLCFQYPLWHKEKKKCPGCAVLNASVGYVIIIQAWDDCLNVQNCLDCFHELSNDYELDIHEWKLLVL